MADRPQSSPQSLREELSLMSLADSAPYTTGHPVLASALASAVLIVLALAVAGSDRSPAWAAPLLLVGAGACWWPIVRVQRRSAMAFKDVRFDRAGLEYLGAGKGFWLWRDGFDGFVVLRRDAEPLRWPVDFSDLGALRRALRQKKSIWGGFAVTLIECDVARIAGHEALRVVTKEPFNFQPRYTGRLLFPSRDLTYEFVVFFNEHGLLGGGAENAYRDYAVFDRAVAGAQVSLESIGGNPTMLGWYADLYDPESTCLPAPAFSGEDGPLARLSKVLLHRSLADDASYDAQFPDHALSRVRRRLACIEHSLVLNSMVTHTAL